MSDQNAQTNGSEKPPRKKGRWLRIALVVSLALNVLIVGFVASRAYHFSGKLWRGQAPVAQVMRQGRKFVHGLPRERRHELWAMIKQRHGEFTVDADEVHGAVRTFADALKQNPFDADHAEEALSRLQAQAQLMLDRGRKVTIEVVSALSQAEREEFAQRLLDSAE